MKEFWLSLSNLLQAQANCQTQARPSIFVFKLGLVNSAKKLEWFTNFDKLINLIQVLKKPIFLPLLMYISSKLYFF